MVGQWMLMLTILEPLADKRKRNCLTFPVGRKIIPRYFIFVKPIPKQGLIEPRSMPELVTILTLFEYRNFSNLFCKAIDFRANENEQAGIKPAVIHDQASNKLLQLTLPNTDNEAAKSAIPDSHLAIAAKI